MQWKLGPLKPAKGKRKTKKVSNKENDRKVEKFDEEMLSSVQLCMYLCV